MPLTTAARRLATSWFALTGLALALGCAQAGEGVLPPSPDRGAEVDVTANSGPDGEVSTHDTRPWPEDRGVVQDTCRPECAGKCQGADDGCGKPCPVNQCKGCCHNKACHAGTDLARCGAEGAPCQACTATAECRQAACNLGLCAAEPQPDGVTCAGGRCRAGSCCKGCWDGSTCRGGISPEYCGLGGIVCNACQESNPCKTANCSTGTCIRANKVFGAGCPSGKCLHGACCTGCISGSTCHGGYDKFNCGIGGGPCKQCPGRQSCNGGFCY